jgi:hypothetical protein
MTANVVISFHCDYVNIHILAMFGFACCLKDKLCFNNQQIQDAMRISNEDWWKVPSPDLLPPLTPLPAGAHKPQEQSLPGQVITKEYFILAKPQET